MSDIRKAQKIIREGLRSRIDEKRTWQDSVADFLTIQFGTVWFFSMNAFFFFLWIVLNKGLIPGIAPFDPYPFNFLTMVVSLEAIFLSVIVLISQNRQGRIADLRDRIDFEVNVRSEKEATKSLIILQKVAEKLEIPFEDDPELAQLEEDTDIREIQRRMEKEKK